ncbi:MAG: hypothetical protein U0175_07020 [Caldilineaceae bacterium]
MAISSRWYHPSRDDRRGAKMREVLVAAVTFPEDPVSIAPGSVGRAIHPLTAS